jgi:hypothetical protein
MWETYSLIGIWVALILLVLDFYLVRKRKIQGRTFFLWFIIGVVLAVFSAVPPMISLVNMLVGTEFTISAVVAVGFLFFILVFFYLDYRISELRSQLMKLAMEVSVAKFGERQCDPNDAEPKKQESKRKVKT